MELSLLFRTIQGPPGSKYSCRRPLRFVLNTQTKRKKNKTLLIFPRKNFFLFRKL